MALRQKTLPSEIKLPQAAIILEEGKDYLFIFDSSSGVEPHMASKLVDMLNDHGFHGMAIVVKDMNGVRVFEQELKEK